MVERRLPARYLIGVELFALSEHGILPVSSRYDSSSVIHFHSAITSSSHTILAQVNSPTEMGGALTEPVAPVPTSHYRAGLIHTLGNFARLRLYEPDEPVPTADEHNNQLSGMESFGDIDQIPRVQGTRFGPGPSHGPTR